MGAMFNTSMKTSKEIRRDNINQLSKDAGGPTRLSEAIGRKPSQVSDWMGWKNIGDDIARLLEESCDKEVGWMDHDHSQSASTKNNVIALHQRPDQVMIDRFDVAGSMGLGMLMPSEHVDVIDRMSVSIEYLRRTVSFSSISNLAIITGYGDSMEGTFCDGDLLLVDRGVNEIKLDAVYVLGLAGELYIKRIQRRPDGTLLMLSDNSKYPPYEIKNGEADKFQVLARVLLAWNAKRL